MTSASVSVLCLIRFDKIILSLHVTRLTHGQNHQLKKFSDTSMVKRVIQSFSADFQSKPFFHTFTIFSHVFFYPTCAYRAHFMRHFPSVCHQTKSHQTTIHISTTKGARVTKFGVGLCWVTYGSTLKVKVKGRGHQAKKCLKVTRQ